ncbi:MAG: mannose-1-phosphate guanylyltransferase/mannose-6-phosphate isomerase [Hyphomicrobiales bacterium]|nr:mannose-1-phosphate guanylyltransferase/mannose-6-phosphate isomerase [Hyphomicrobiales bacterium]
MHIVPVILCGGNGLRLWPVSSRSLPKQFLPLIGTRTLFEETLDRVAAPELFDRPIVITNNRFRFLAAEQIATVEAGADIVLEPAQRDSAAAVAAAAFIAARRNPEALVLVVAADHFIADADKFRAACRGAIAAAQAGYIVTFGVAPEFAATGYGYIRPGAPITDTGARKAAAFVEKPDAATARGYVEAGYLWNSGNFLFRAEVMIAELRRHAPELAGSVDAAVAAAIHDADFIRLDGASFDKAPRTSIDYAIMEKTDRAAVLQVDYGWSDIGSWEAVWRISKRDANGNAVVGPGHVEDCRNLLVYSASTVRTVAVGLKDIAIIATDDTVLVVARSYGERIKALAARFGTAADDTELDD